MPLFVKGQKRLPNAGRKKGQPNRATIQRRLAERDGNAATIKAIKSKEMPLDFLLRKMRDPSTSPSEQFLAARSAVGFCHPQLQAVAHRHVDASGNPIAPVVTVTVVSATAEAPKPAPRLTIEGPKPGDKVQ